VRVRHPVHPTPASHEKFFCIHSFNRINMCLPLPIEWWVTVNDGNLPSSPSLTITHQHRPIRHGIHLTITYHRHHSLSLTIIHCTYHRSPSFIIAHHHLKSLTSTHQHTPSLTITHQHTPTHTIAYHHSQSIARHHVPSFAITHSHSSSLTFALAITH
jgi:hypothetical protein